MAFKPPHKVDPIGLPEDHEMREFEFHLGDLAAEYRGTGSLERRELVVQEYGETLQRLYALGWDDLLDVESELPQSVMPGEYLKRHPHVGKWK